MGGWLDSFGARGELAIGARRYQVHRLDALARTGVGDVTRLPYALRLVLENLLRHEDGHTVTRDDIATLAAWRPGAAAREVQLRPARVLMQDSAGVPALCDLAALRDAFARRGLDPAAIQPACPVDLIIDHSIQVDAYGSRDALAHNTARELARNRERYELLRWSGRAFRGVAVLPPGTGILHQVNLEHLATVIRADAAALYPDSVIGTDSHTPMINALGIMGWGVGGIEAEAVMLGQPVAMQVPEVVGAALTGSLPPGVTATDLVLAVTERLRAAGVIDTFVEFCGDGAAGLAVPDRATVANMAPEYGATMGLFPIDAATLAYLEATGRAPDHVALVERYAKDNLLWRDPTERPRYSRTIDIDLAQIEPAIAGPSRPQDRVPLHAARSAWRRALPALTREPGAPRIAIDGGATLGHGDVVIAAITSCTNTSNPDAMLTAGLVARRARARGLTAAPWVKTSLAPGSQVVTDYLAAAGLLDDLEALGFHLVGYGCTTCVGNSGPLRDDVARAIRAGGLAAVAVLSGNRNFEGRVHPLARASYLASPPLVVAYAIAGTIDRDLVREPLGTDRDGAAVWLHELWPDRATIAAMNRTAVRREQFMARYAALDGDAAWRALAIPAGDRFAWNPASTYLRPPPFFDVTDAPPPPAELAGARALAVLGDSITTDHISPAGAIAPGSPAARFLDGLGVAAAAYNQYNTRRGNHDVLVRATFAHPRLRNAMVPDVDGGVTRHVPSGDRMTIYDAAVRYAAEGVPLVVIAGADYGMGSSRDWAAKGVALLGVRAVIARGFERIHRANLVGMGVLPLQLDPGVSAATLGLTGDELFAIDGLAGGPAPHQRVMVRAGAMAFPATVRADTAQEAAYLRHGGILPYVLRERLAAHAAAASARSRT